MADVVKNLLPSTTGFLINRKSDFVLNPLNFHGLSINKPWRIAECLHRIECGPLEGFVPLDPDDPGFTYKTSFVNRELYDDIAFVPLMKSRFRVNGWLLVQWKIFLSRFKGRHSADGQAVLSGQVALTQFFIYQYEKRMGR